MWVPSLLANYEMLTLAIGGYKKHDKHGSYTPISSFLPKRDVVGSLVAHSCLPFLSFSLSLSIILELKSCTRRIQNQLDYVHFVICKGCAKNDSV